MLTLLVHLAIVVLVLCVVWWLLTLVPLPHPFPLVLRVIFVIIALIVVVDLLLGLTGSNRLLWR